MKNIVLIGFMGIGKGTLARALSAKSGLFAVDTDDLIESLTNKKIKNIFEKKGEKYFRELEQKVADWLEYNVKNSIISTGGGFYKVKNIKKIGIVIYLDADFDWIYNRITKSKNAEKKIKKRPLFKSYSSAKILYEKRINEYKKIADIIIDVQNKDTKDLIDEILKKVKI
ncbi:MAG TPA: shikimate kinase [Campylobacterales bacterium]|nr:shikimate kinase [Campylobacterales bacterium]